MRILNPHMLTTTKRSLLPALTAAALLASPVHAQSDFGNEDELCRTYSESIVLSYFLQKHGASKELVETALNEYFAFTYESAEVTTFLEEMTGPSVGAAGTLPNNLSDEAIASRTGLFGTICGRNIALFKENGTIKQ